MWEYLTLHESFIRGALAGDHGEVDWAELHSFHERQIGYLQHERLVHLLVTLFVAALWLASLAHVAVNPGWTGVALVGLVLIWLGAYLLHYFRLENGVQRLYHLANRIDAQLGRAGATYHGDQTTPNWPDST